MRLPRVGFALALQFLSGCGTAFFPALPDAEPVVIEDGNADQGGLRTIGAQRGEPNGTFAQAIPALLDAAGRGALRGTIQAIGDLDVYDLGARKPGDRIVVDVNASGGVLDSSVAMFDAERKVFTENDDRGETIRPLDARIDEVVRHESSRYYLVIGAAAFAGSAAERLGPYHIDLAVIPGQPVPPPRRQTLLLDFDGGPVDAPSIPVSFVGPFDADALARGCGACFRAGALSEVSPFEAGKISPLYEGQTADLMRLIVAVVRENFERFGVDIITSDDPIPDDEDVSVVLFGGDNPIAFGIAESIDHYNTDRAEQVVVFTASFQSDVFSAPPTLEALAAAIGNVASHEAGHILGLNHVNDSRDLMDAVSPADTLVADQEFGTSPLSEQILPIGLQDGVLLLEETVGPR